MKPHNSFFSKNIQNAANSININSMKNELKRKFLDIRKKGDNSKRKCNITKNGFVSKRKLWFLHYFDIVIHKYPLMTLGIKISNLYVQSLASIETYYMLSCAGISTKRHIYFFPGRERIMK